MNLSKLKIFSVILIICILSPGFFNQIALAEDDFKKQANEILTGVVEKNSRAEEDLVKKYSKDNAELRSFKLNLTNIEKTSSQLKSGNVANVLYYVYKNPAVDNVPVLAETGMVLKIWANSTTDKWTLLLAADGKAINLIDQNQSNGPDLSIDSPDNLSEFDYSRVVIKGKTDPSAILLINNLIIEVNSSGGFEAPVYLSANKNIFSLTAINTKGGQTRKTITLIYKGAGKSSQLAVSSDIQLSEEKVVKQETFSYIVKLKNLGSDEIVDLKLSVDLPKGVSLLETNPKFSDIGEQLVVIDSDEPLGVDGERDIGIKVSVNSEAEMNQNLPIKVSLTGSNNSHTDNLIESIDNQGPILVKSKGGGSIWVFVIPLLFIFYILISLGSGYLIAKQLVKRSMGKN